MAVWIVEGKVAWGETISLLIDGNKMETVEISPTN
jgi:hypothetical protein